MFRRAHHFLLAAMVLAIATATVVPAARAEPMLTGLEELGVAVSDEELSTMRGRFVTPNGITYFGLEMQTLWQAPDGATTQARLLINLDIGGTGKGAVPQIYISWTRDESNSALDVPVDGQQSLASTGSGLIPVGGLDTVHGAVQSQQIAGTDNSVRNGMTVSIGPVGGARPSSAGMTPITGNMTENFTDGDSIQFLLSGNRVGIVMTGQGTDAVRQTVESGANQLAQHVMINSNDNDIVSRMNLTIGVDPAANAGAIAATNALNAKGGNGF